MKEVIEGFVISDPRGSDEFPIFVMNPIIYSSGHHSLTIEHMIEDHCLCVAEGSRPDAENGLNLGYLRQAFRRAKAAFTEGRKCIHLYFKVECEIDPESRGVYKITNYMGSERLNPGKHED